MQPVDSGEQDMTRDSQSLLTWQPSKTLVPSWIPCAHTRRNLARENHSPWQTKQRERMRKAEGSATNGGGGNIIYKQRERERERERAILWLDGEQAQIILLLRPYRTTNQA